jgi:hypothetical protein
MLNKKDLEAYYYLCEAICTMKQFNALNGNVSLSLLESVKILIDKLILNQQETSIPPIHIENPELDK